MKGTGGSLHVPPWSKRDDGTVGPDSARGRSAIVRCSLTPDVRARLMQMRSNHVLKELRPSNFSAAA